MNVFISHHPADAAALQELEKFLAPLSRKRALTVWHRGRVAAGEDVEKRTSEELCAAQLILILVSADYIADEACQGEALRVEDRRQAGLAEVVPIVASHCDTSALPFRRLQALPRTGEPVTAAGGAGTVWLEIVREVEALVDEIARRTPSTPRYQDGATQRLSEQLRQAEARRARLQAAGGSTAEVEREILDLKRSLREGGQLRAGDTLGRGRYVLLDRLGEGGFATVWRASDRERGATVAVKVLHPHLAADSVRRGRFLRGARRMADLEHPGIVRVLQEAGEDGGYHCPTLGGLKPSPSGDGFSTEGGDAGLGTAGG